VSNQALLKEKYRESGVIAGRERWKREQDLAREQFVVMAYRKHNLELSSRFGQRRVEIVMTLGKRNDKIAERNFSLSETWLEP
jgi:hypothetical protein